MQNLLRILPILPVFFCDLGLAQEVRTAPVTTMAVLPMDAPINDGNSSGSSSPLEKPDFEIESTQIKLIDVVEPPPLAGLPPVEGIMTLKIHSVADPGLPNSPLPVLPVSSHESAASGESLELIEDQHESHFAFVSATVYDHRRTNLTCYPSGGGNAVTVWSNIDFNHFSGVGSFEAISADGETRVYYLMMGIGNEDTESLRELASVQSELDWEIPAIPALPDGAPAFVVETENPDPASLRLIEDLHALYRTEGERMVADAAAREKAYVEKKAHLLANPPKPKDVTVHFWKREAPMETPPAEGGLP